MTQDGLYPRVSIEWRFNGVRTSHAMIAPLVASCRELSLALGSRKLNNVIREVRFSVPSVVQYAVGPIVECLENKVVVRSVFARSSRHPPIELSVARRRERERRELPRMGLLPSDVDVTQRDSQPDKPYIRYTSLAGRRRLITVVSFVERASMTAFGLSRSPHLVLSGRLSDSSQRAAGLTAMGERRRRISVEASSPAPSRNRGADRLEGREAGRL